MRSRTQPQNIVLHAFCCPRGCHVRDQKVLRHTNLMDKQRAANRISQTSSNRKANSRTNTMRKKLFRSDGPPILWTTTTPLLFTYTVQPQCTHNIPPGNQCETHFKFTMGFMCPAVAMAHTCPKYGDNLDVPARLMFCRSGSARVTI